MSITITPDQAAHAYAMALNTLDTTPLEPLLADDFHYASQWVFEEITSKADYLRYLRSKFHTLRDGRNPVFAELGHVYAYGEDQPCVVLAQGSRRSWWPSPCSRWPGTASPVSTCAPCRHRRAPGAGASIPA